jgi:hypothetical protein
MVNDAYDASREGLKMSWFRLTIIHAGKSEYYPEGETTLGVMASDPGCGRCWDRTLGKVGKELPVQEAQQWAEALIRKDEDLTPEERAKRIKEDRELEAEFIEAMIND